MKKSSLLLLATIVMLISACETRSKFVAENIHTKNQSAIEEQCLESVRSVEKRQLIKNSSIIALPLGSVLYGGLSLVTMAIANAGITLDDEINANKIARACGLKKHFRENTDIALTIASNSAVSAITGKTNFVGAPIQNGLE